MFWDMSLGSLWRHKMRSGLTVLGIILAIAAIVALGSISEGINSLVQEQLKFASGYISVEEAGVATASQSQAGPPGMGMRIDKSLADDIAQISGVKRVALQTFSLSPSNNIFVVGIQLDDLEYFDMQNIEFVEGGLPEPGAKELTLGYTIAEAKGLKQGDEIDINGEKYEISGIMEEQGSFMDLAAITSLEAAVDTFDFGDYVSGIVVEPEDLSEIERIAAEIEELSTDINAETPEERAKTANDIIGGISVFTLGIGVVASIVASIGIINTMVMAVLERKREFGIMKALGAERGVVLRVVLQEAALLGVIGGVIGISLGFIGTEALNQAYPFPIASISFRLAAISFAYSIILAMLAALYPAYKAVQVDAVEAMREE